MSEVVDVTLENVESAYAEFWDDFYEVVKAQDAIESYLPYYGLNDSFDEGLQDLVVRQKQIISDLTTVYGELYDYLNETQQVNIGGFIRRSVQTLHSDSLPQGLLGRLGVAPLLLAAGITLTILAGGALLAYHRNISLQKERLAMQEKLLPLVASGEISADVLETISETTASDSGGIFGNLFSNIQTLLLVGVGIYFLWPIIQEKVLKKQ